MNRNIGAVILAGGKGTRMQTHLPKVLHQLGDRPMVFHTLDIIKGLNLYQVVVVVGHLAEVVQTKIQSQFECDFALQPDPLGTGDALRHALMALKVSVGTILVVNGDDSAFYRPNTLKLFIANHLAMKAKLSMMTLELPDERKLGKILRDNQGNFNGIVESSDLANIEHQSDEINCGAYVFDRKWVSENIDMIPVSSKGEYYITELFNIAKAKQDKIELFKLQEKSEWSGVNTQEELLLANFQFQQKLKEV